MCHVPEAVIKVVIRAVIQHAIKHVPVVVEMVAVLLVRGLVLADAVLHVLAVALEAVRVLLKATVPLVKENAQRLAKLDVKALVLQVVKVDALPGVQVVVRAVVVLVAKALARAVVTRDAQAPVIQDVILPVKMGVKVHVLAVVAAVVDMVALTPVPEPVVAVA